MTSQRLDEALAQRGLVQSRARGRDAVLRGVVRVNGVAARKPSQGVMADDALSLADDTARYVSRAALKLLHGLADFGISPLDRVCLDLGASTGGFTQVLLEQGARSVIAIDVGHAQMAQALQDDPRVTLYEGLNARALQRSQMPEDVSLIVCDVSFISLQLALPQALDLAAAGTLLLALIKPQFEVGRDHVGKGGIVTDEAERQRVCDVISRFLEEQGWKVSGVVPASLEGGDGNQEYLIAACKQ